jgi:hypothetical protein
MNRSAESAGDPRDSRARVPPVVNRAGRDLGDPVTGTHRSLAIADQEADLALDDLEPLDQRRVAVGPGDSGARLQEQFDLDQGPGFVGGFGDDARHLPGHGVVCPLRRFGR